MPRRLDIDYDPYKRKTKVLIDNVDVQANNEHLIIKEFIDNRVPLQTWVEPIKQKGWDGIVSHLIRKNDAGKIEVKFSGRLIDYEDLKRSLQLQAVKRGKDYPVQLKFEHIFSRDDKDMMDSIKYVKDKMLSDEFKAVMKEVKDKEILEFYENLECNFAQVFDSEFRIVFAGTYSCGKSSIINALIGKTILPMYTQTTTTKKCKIIHNVSVGKKIHLVALNVENNIVADEWFDEDEECRNRFEQLSPKGQTGVAPNGVNEIHIFLDLSHLYPKDNRNELSKNFRLVLIDTPGSDSMNSKEKENDTTRNIEKEIALSAINGQDKEIVIICTDEHYEGESLGELLYSIHCAAKDDNAFNDRFFFVMNKCDNLIGKMENLSEHRERFKGLIDSSKWGVQESFLNPRVFMISAETKLNVQKGVYSLSDTALSGKEARRLDNEKTLLNRMYRDGCVDSEARLFLECDLPIYRKDEMASAFSTATAADDKETALELLSGIKCMESAIQDYILRYAYPIKIQKLLLTFKSLLDVVHNLSIQQNTMLEEIGTKLGEKNLSRKGVEASLAEKEREKEEKEKLKERINSLLAKTSELDSVPERVAKIRQKFDEVWNSEPIVKKARSVEENATMKRDEYEKVKSELTALFEKIRLEVLNDYTELQTEERRQFMIISKEILDIYKSVVGTSLEKLAKLSMDCLNGLQEDPMTLLDKMLQRTEGGKTKETERLSRGARMWRSIVKFFTLGRYGNIDSYDVYPWSHIHQEMNRIEGNFNSQCSDIKNRFIEASQTMKEATEMSLRKIEEGIESAGAMLNDYEIEIDKIKDDEQAFRAEKQRIENNILLLNELSEKIERT